MSYEMLALARRAAAAGGQVLCRYFQEGLVVEHKETAVDLVSNADVESERTIIELLRSERPNDAILAEESHQTAVADAEHLWIIDPLDGTTNFAHGIPHAAVSVAYYQRGEPVAGVIYNPMRGDWYTALRGQGAFYNDRPAHVANHASLAESLVGVGFYYDRGAMMEATLAAVGDLFRENIHGIRRFGTAALDLCQVGVGMFGGFFEYQLSPWDFAAGRLFVEEAGGRVTTCAGEPLPLAKTTILASNSLLHEAMLTIVRQHQPHG